jgi:hypothetical protein
MKEKYAGYRDKTQSVNLWDESSVARDPANAFEKHKVFVVYNRCAATLESFVILSLAEGRIHRNFKIPGLA